ncbi:conserved protein of unknown function [Paraburkholderia kururiensis]
MHSASLLPEASCSCGSATDAGSCEANTRSPHEPVSTSTWSIVWHCAVPGAHTVTLTNGMLGTPLTPGSTVTAAALAASAGCDDVVLVTGCAGAAVFVLVLLPVLALAPDPPPPPPQAARIKESASAMKDVLSALRDER